MLNLILRGPTTATIPTEIRDQLIVGGVGTVTITIVDRTNLIGRPVGKINVILGPAHQRLTDLLSTAKIDLISTISCLGRGGLKELSQS